MACWVVPKIAAEYWNVSLDHVLHQIAEGKIQSKVDSGFTFVDLFPKQEQILSTPTQKQSPPMTFVLVSKEEMDALHGDSNSDAEEEIEMEIGDIDWRPQRQRAARLRTPPPMRAA